MFLIRRVLIPTAIILCITFSLVAQSPWPTEQGDNYNSGWCQSVVGPSDPQVWIMRITEDFDSLPIIANDGTIVISGSERDQSANARRFYVYLIKLTSNRRDVWRVFQYETLDKVESTPTITYNGNVAAVDVSGILYYFDPEGEELAEPLQLCEEDSNRNDRPIRASTWDESIFCVLDDPARASGDRTRIFRVDLASSRVIWVRGACSHWEENLSIGHHFVLSTTGDPILPIRWGDEAFLIYSRNSGKCYDSGHNHPNGIQPDYYTWTAVVPAGPFEGDLLITDSNPASLRHIERSTYKVLWDTEESLPEQEFSASKGAAVTDRYVIAHDSSPSGRTDVVILWLDDGSEYKRLEDFDDNAAGAPVVDADSKIYVVENVFLDGVIVYCYNRVGNLVFRKYLAEYTPTQRMGLAFLETGELVVPLDDNDKDNAFIAIFQDW